MKIAIVGYDTEGRASYDYFAAQEHELAICDQNPAVQVPDGVEAVLGDGYLDNLGRFDLVVRTAGLPPRLILEKNPGIDNKVTTLVNEFLRVCPTKNVIGVTGTKGKGTTSTLITKMLEAGGKQVHLGGNIGMPPLSFLPELTPDSWVVLELSSFQLIDLRYSPHLAVCLMVVPEHLNWHTDMPEYLAAKSRLFMYQTPDDIGIYYAGNELSKQIASAGSGQKLPYYEPPGAAVDNGAISISGQAICRTDELKLLGRHNWQNACAAVTAAWQVTQNAEVIRSVLTTFGGLPHRIELVREVAGVCYYNDSYASGLHATEAAILAVPGKKVMILGGYERMIPIDFFGKFAVEHASEFRELLLIGVSAERLAGVLDKANFSNYIVDKQAQTMSQIVAKATSLAETGDAIVLSPGFASFDMFKNFEDRGLQYKAAVENL